MRKFVSKLPPFPGWTRWVKYTYVPMSDEDKLIRETEDLMMNPPSLPLSYDMLGLNQGGRFFNDYASGFNSAFGKTGADLYLNSVRALQDKFARNLKKPTDLYKRATGVAMEVVVLDSFPAIQLVHDEHTKQSRHFPPKSQRRFGRQGAGPLRSAPLFQGARRTSTRRGHAARHH